MPEFLRLMDPQQALDSLFNAVSPRPEVETVATEDALGRVITEDVHSPQALPDFRRSTVDGFAVKAADTHGAGDLLPAYLEVVGEIPMGGRAEIVIREGTTAVIHTGGMVPEGADAVVMMEYTQALDNQQLEVFRPAAVGENIIEIGEDITRGEVVLPRGTRLQPADIGGLMALGIVEINAAKKPRVAIISSGDEVISPSRVPVSGQVRDINSYTLSALIEQAGGIPVRWGIISDQREQMTAAIRKAHQETDLVVVTAGSSASSRDLTAEIMDQMGDPGVLVHGVNIKPGKPTILAAANQKIMVGLPGNPVSALVIAGLFIKPILRKMLGQTRPHLQPTISARMTINVSSQTGREDYIPVQLSRNEQGEWYAEPVFGKSNLIFVLVKAQGLVKIPAEKGGLEAGQSVSVQIF